MSKDKNQDKIAVNTSASLDVPTQLDKNLFAEEEYQELQDFLKSSVEVGPRGRKNPFAPAE